MLDLLLSQHLVEYLGRYKEALLNDWMNDFGCENEQQSMEEILS